MRQVARHFRVEAFPLLLKLSEPHQDMLGIALIENDCVLLDISLDKVHFFSHGV